MYSVNYTQGQGTTLFKVVVFVGFCDTHGAMSLVTYLVPNKKKINGNVDTEAVMKTAAIKLYLNMKTWDILRNEHKQIKRGY